MPGYVFEDIALMKLHRISHLAARRFNSGGVQRLNYCLGCLDLIACQAMRQGRVDIVICAIPVTSQVFEVSPGDLNLGITAIRKAAAIDNRERGPRAEP